MKGQGGVIEERIKLFEIYECVYGCGGHRFIKGGRSKRCIR